MYASFLKDLDARREKKYKPDKSLIKGEAKLIDIDNIIPILIYASFSPS